MNPHWERLLKEQYEKEVKYFRINDSYFPNYKQTILTSKFYSYHEHLDLSKADPVIVDTIKTYLDKGPKEKYDWPVTESQKYGWFNTPLVELDRKDPRFYFPSITSPLTRHEMKLKQDKNMQIPKFIGIPWK